MRKQRTTVKFVLQNVSKVTGKCKINLLFICHNCRSKVSTGIDVDPGWTEESNTDDLIQFKLDDIRQKINQIVVKTLRDGKEIVASEVIHQLKKPQFGRTSENICEFIQKYNAQHQQKSKETTRYNYNLVRSYLLSWGSDITFKDMGKDNLISFESWLISNDWLNSTINKVMTSLLYIIKLAEQSNLEVHQSYKHFKPIPGKSEGDVVALTKEELSRLISLQLDGANERIRDMFVFSCATGMRYSDIVSLEWHNVRDGKITYYAIKTGVKTDIILNSTSRLIIERNRGNKYPVPRATNGYCNIKIKEICKLAGITDMVDIVLEKGVKKEVITQPKHELIQFHTGRRTFATIMTTMGVPDAQVMKMTGHKNHDNFKRYIGFTDSMQESFMLLWDK